jgi:hypothetical protein
MEDELNFVNAFWKYFIGSNLGQQTHGINGITRMILASILVSDQAELFLHYADMCQKWRRESQLLKMQNCLLEISKTPPLSPCSIQKYLHWQTSILDGFHVWYCVQKREIVSEKRDYYVDCVKVMGSRALVPFSDVFPENADPVPVRAFFEFMESPDFNVPVAVAALASAMHCNFSGWDDEKVDPLRWKKIEQQAQAVDASVWNRVKTQIIEPFFPMFSFWARFKTELQKTIDGIPDAKSGKYLFEVAKYELEKHPKELRWMDALEILFDAETNVEIKRDMQQMLREIKLFYS